MAEGMWPTLMLLVPLHGGTYRLPEGFTPPPPSEVRMPRFGLPGPVAPAPDWERYWRSKRHEVLIVRHPVVDPGEACGLGDLEQLGDPLLPSDERIADEVLPFLLDALDDDPPLEVRRALLVGAGRLGADEHRGALRDALSSTEESEVAAAVVGLALLGLVDGDRAHLSDAAVAATAPRVARLVERVLEPERVAPLEQPVPSPARPLTARRALELALWARGDGLEHAALRALLVKEARTPRDAADEGGLLLAIGLLPSEAGLELLRARLSDGGPGARGAAALALGLAGDHGRTADLVRMLRSADRAAVEGAALGLGQLDAHAGVEPMLVRLRGTSDLRTARALAHGIGACGDLRAIEVLLPMITDAGLPATMRASAVWALVGTCDRRARSWRASYPLELVDDL